MPIMLKLTESENTIEIILSNDHVTAIAASRTRAVER